MNYELYHYGVKGMKWGVRKSKEERYSDWKKRQHLRLDQQTAKDQAKWDNKITKTKDRISKNGQTETSRMKLKTLEGKKNASKTLNKIGHEQINKLGRSDYDDIVKTQKTMTAMSAVTIALAATGTLPFAYFHVPNTDLDFRDYRVRHSDLEPPEIKT